MSAPAVPRWEQIAHRRRRRIVKLGGRVGWFAAAAAVCACTARAGDDIGVRTVEPTPIVANAVAAQSEPAAPLGQMDPPPMWPLFPDDASIDWSANRTMKVLGRIAERATQTEYWRGGARVDERRGNYAFDCSGMVEWVLQKAAPAAGSYSAQGLGHRPLAIDFQRRIASVPPDEERRGWRRISRIEDAQPGDVIAWIKPAIISSPNTGHVGFLVFKPARVPGRDEAYLVRIADSTSLLHEDDTRVGRKGFGLGTIVVLTDPATGSPRGYGWVGLRAWTFETAIAIGRPLR